MLSKALQLIIQAIIFLLIYTIMRYILQLTDILAVLILILLVILFRPLTDRMFSKYWDRLFRGKYLKIEQGLDIFENQIGEISHYHELFPQLYYLFNILFAPRTWLFYVFEDSGFRIVEFDTSKLGEGLPIEINLNNNFETENIVNLNDLEKPSTGDFGFNIEMFLNQQLDTLIPIRGKSQTVALIFTAHSNLNFIHDSRIDKKAGRILLKAGQLFESTALYLDIIQRNLEIKKVFSVSKKLLSSLNTDDILDFLLDALSEVIHFDAGVIFLVDPERKKLYQKVSKGYEKGQDLTLKLGQGACGWVAETRKISLIMDVDMAKHYYPIRKETRSQVSIPLVKQKELMGVLSLESNEKNGFSNQSLELLKLFANQAIIALDNARQYEISLTKKHLEHELVNAAKVQKVLLPQHPPHFDNLNISFVHIPSKLVSGDLFDLASIDEHLLGLVVGDVSGKGAAAAIMMSLVLAGFRAYKKSHLTVCEIVARLNNLLEESVSVGHYATLFYALISTKQKSITFTNAGHNPPLLFRVNGSIEELTVGGIVLGYLVNQIYQQITVPFHPGDLLLTYTDGITEALNIQDEEFGEARLRAVVKKNLNLNSYELKNKILEEVDNFTQSEIISDDRTIVIVKHL